MNEYFDEIIKKELAAEENIQQELSQVKKIIESSEKNEIKLSKIRVILEELQNAVIEAKATAVLESRTGLFGPKFAEDFLAKEMENSKREKIPLCVAFFDFDYLKRINDEYGHVVGTKAILEVAEIIKSKVRKSDIVSRYGGDEFLVIFRNSQCAKANKAIERINQAVSDLLVDGKAKVSLSVGIQEYRGEEGETVESLLEKADQDLYSSKEKRLKQDQPKEDSRD